MELTLSELLDKHPEVAAEHAAKLSAGKEIELAAAKEVAVATERARIASFLSQCKPHHFSKTAAHPKGFVLHAIENSLSEVDCLKGIIELNDKAATMIALEEASADIPVGSAEPNDKQLSPEAAAEASLLSIVNGMKGGA